MKRYKLLKDLPTLEAGNDGFYLDSDGNLMNETNQVGHTIIPAPVLARNPHILTEWFEEIPEQPKTAWDLKEGDTYYALLDYGAIVQSKWVNTEKYNQECRRELGNVFLTYKEAKKERARRKAKVILERDTKGFKPDPSLDYSESYFCVYYDYNSRRLRVGCLDNNFGGISFGTYTDAKASIKTHEKEWKIYLGVEEE